MKRLCISIILLIGLAAPSVCAGETIPSRITDVTLFSGEALVTRKATAAVQKGMHELLIELEAFRVDSDSVSANVMGAGEVYGVQIKEVPVQTSPRVEIADLEKKISELRDSRRVLTDQREVLSKKEKFVEALLSFAGTEVSKDIQTRFPKIEDISRTLAFLGSQLQTINKGRQAVDQKVNAVDEESKRLTRELAQLGTERNKVRRFIEIVFNSSRAQTVDIETSYMCRNADWQPLYKVAVPPSLKAVELTMFSKIRQKTGEDWNNATVSLSNVIPLKGIEPPKPSPWVLDIPRHESRARKGAEKVLMERAIRAPAADSIAEGVHEAVPEEEASIAVARTTELPLSFEYELPRKMTLESKDKETIVPLFERKLEGKYFHYAVPKENPLTFLLCEATADKELLSGPLNVYFGGRYVGKTYVREKRAGEAFRVNLGADREVKISRVKVKDKIKETFFGNIQRDTVVREFSYKLTVENLKNKPVLLLLLDSIPVSRTDRIKVADIAIRPEPTERNDEDREGVMRWDLPLKGGEKADITIDFVVSYPKDSPIFGL